MPAGSPATKVFFGNSASTSGGYSRGLHHGSSGGASPRYLRNAVRSLLSQVLAGSSSALHFETHQARLSGIEPVAEIKVP